MAEEDKTDTELLRKFLQQADEKTARITLEQMTGENGLLKSLGAALSKLLQDPLLQKTLDCNAPPDGKLH